MDETVVREALKRVIGLVEMEQEREFVSNAELFDQLISAYSTQLNAQFAPTRVSQGYAGLNLGQIYEDSDLTLLIKSFKHSQQLDAFYVLKIITDAKAKLAQMPNIRMCAITSPNEPGCIIFGDLHGNFHDLCHVIDKYGLPGLNYKFVFNGDFVDRGPKQLEVLLTILYAFLIRPERVFINRGNHEDVSLNTSANFNPNFMSAFAPYRKYSSYLFSASVDMFCSMPLATIVRNDVLDYRYFVVHGGLSDQIDLNFLQHKVDRFKFRRVGVSGEELKNRDVKMVSDLLWSDPITKSAGCYFNKRRNLGCLFGYDVTDEFCRQNSFAAVIRSHEVKDEGFSEDQARCWTIFSASYYCGGHNYGAVLKIEPNQRQSKVYKFKNRSEQDSSSAIANYNYQLIKEFKKLIQTRQKRLLENCQRYDTNRNGTIKIGDWAQILSNEFRNEISPAHLITLKDFLCQCETNLGLVHYMTMFKRKQDGRLENPADSSYLGIIINLFQILDKNGDGKISIGEAQEALLKINQKLGQNYSIQNDCINFIRSMDKNGDNQIDLEEFKRAFFS